MLIRTRCFLLAVLALLLGNFSLRANSLSKRQAPEFSVSVSNSNETKLLVKLPDIEIEEVDEGDQSFQVIRIPGAGCPMGVGEPELPVIARLVAIPPGASVNVNVGQCDYSVMSNIRVMPSQETEQDGKRKNFLSIDKTFGAQDGFYPDSIVEVGSPIMLRDCRVIPLIVHPVQYNPLRHELKVYRDMRVTLAYQGGDGIDVTSYRRVGRSEAFDKLYRGAILNYDSSLWTLEAERGGYLIITPDQYFPALQPLAEWKRQKGHHTEVVTLSQIGSNPDHSRIRDYIQEFYLQSSPPLEYVILVGDMDEMPTFFYRDEMEDWGYDTADHPYSMLEGDDYFPDVLVGRLSVSSKNEMATVVNKIVSYESNPYRGQTDWYKRALMVCNYGGNSSARTTKIWVRDKLLNNGYTQVDTSFIYDYWCDVGFLSSVLNSGVSFVNYRGWIDWGGWTSSWFPPVNFENIYRLHNGFMLPIVTDMVCNALDFREFCPAEAWLRAGTVVNPRGAVAVVGPTAMNTRVNFNNVLDGGFYSGVFDDSLFTVGQALARAKMELYMQYPLNRGPGHAWNSVECYFYMYTLMGDPGLDMWTEIPQDFIVEHPAIVPVGSNHLNFAVKDTLGQPLDQAYVCITDGSEIISKGFTDSNGEIQLPVSAGAGCSYTVTVTKHNFKPYQTVIICEQNPIHVTISGHHVDDDSSGESEGDGDGHLNPGERIEISLSLQNTGFSETASSVSGEMRSTDPYVTIMKGDVSFGDISPGETVWGREKYLLSLAPSCPDGHECRLSLGVTDNSGNNWSNLYNIMVEAPAFSVQTIDIEDSDQVFPNGCLDPGETVQLTVTIANEGQRTGGNIHATIWTADQIITPIHSTAYFGTIEIGGKSDNSDDPFEVVADIGTFPGHQVQFLLFIESNSEMLDTAALSLSVGVVSEPDPVGPDSYGYYAYDNRDWPYQERPLYEWIEIDPSYGGPGTVLNFVDEQGPDSVFYEHIQGDTKVLPLPFPFQYYGTSYDEISVCSNGWISMGSTWMTNFRNWSIPGVLNPPCLIAPFWDDLYVGEGSIAYYYDEQKHRLIVEWSRVYNDYGETLETFQVILYDPSYYTSVTGDGEILFQYHSVNNSDYAENFATVGIESPDNKDGVQYTYARQYSPGAAELRSGLAIKFTTGRHRVHRAFLDYYGCIVDDDNLGKSAGDGDGLLDAGERIELGLRLVNLGDEPAEGIKAILRSTDHNASVEDSLQTFPDTTPGDTARSDGPFVIQIVPECENGHVIEFELEIEVSGAFCSKIRFYSHIVAPIILLETHSTDEVLGDGDERPESGEMWELSISLQNEGDGQATGVWGLLTTDDENITVLQETAEFPDIPSRSTGFILNSPFVFSISDETPFHSASFDLSIFSNNDQYNIIHNLEIVIERAYILLVDDDGGDDIENYYTQALDKQDWSYERYDRLNESCLDTFKIHEHGNVIWFTGSENDSTLTPSDQDWLTTFLDRGGSLFLTGQNIAADLQGSSFLTDYLHTDFVADSSSDIWMVGVPDDPITGEYPLLSLLSGDYGANNQTSPDEIEVLEGATPMLTYYSSGQPAALRYMNSYRLVFFAVGFESLINFYDVASAFEMRADILRRIVDWFHFEPQIGDVNEDGLVNILDIVYVINIILELKSDPSDYQTWAADLTGDGHINVVDVVGIVNTILDGSSFK